MKPATEQSIEAEHGARAPFVLGEGPGERLWPGTPLGPEVISRRRRIAVFLVAAVLAIALVTAVAVHMRGKHRLNASVATLQSGEPEERIAVLNEIARLRDDRVSDAVRHVLRTSSDRATLDMAGYAVMRIRDGLGLDLLRYRAGQGPDDIVRAKLIIYAARLADRDQTPASWMREGLASQEPWQRTGAAAGLLILGHPEAGERLLAEARDGAPELRAFALEQFEEIARPLFEAAGRPFDGWADAIEWPSGDPRWTQLEDRWRRLATASLLDNVLTRLHRHDPLWHEQNRVLHARDRVAEYLN